MVKPADYDINQEILRKKYLLIRRDPLSQELDYALSQFFGKKKDAKRMGISFDSGYPKEIKEALEELESIRRKIQQKWGCHIYIPEIIWSGQVHQCLWTISDSKSEIDRVTRVEAQYVGKDQNGEDIFFLLQTFANSSPDKSHLYVAGSDDLVIRVDTSLIDSHDAKRLKGKFWAIVKEELEKKKQKPQGKKEVTREPDVLRDLYHIKSETFDKYLKWYDLNIKDKWSFRSIAFMESQKILKKRVGFPVKGEDAVEKGVKRIYMLIHRRLYLKPEGEMREYNCPDHGSFCPPNCPYLLKWQNEFDRKYPA